MPNQSERLLFINNLDSERVSYYRRVLACEPLRTVSELERQLMRLANIAVEVDKLLEEFQGISSAMIKAEVPFTPTVIELAVCTLDAQPEGWRKPRVAVTYKQSREEWSKRPTNRQALAAWNRFVIALGATPVRIYRVSVRRDNEWEGEFKRADSSLMYVSLTDLEGKERELRTVGWVSFGSLSSIVQQIGDWLMANPDEFE